MSGTLGTSTTLIENALGPVGESLISGFPSRFSTGNTALPPALYSLSLRYPNPPYFPIFFYTFPISPRNIRKTVTAMSNIYDVQGPPQTRGVNRIVDIYGESPPIWTIEGTTGQKTHSTDGGFFTGLESILILQGVISQYFSLNAQRAQQGFSSTYRLEFYDFFTSDFYEVVPVGPQSFHQNALTPSFVYYRFVLMGVQSLVQPITNVIDPIFTDFTTGVGALSQSITNTVQNIYNNYAS